MPEILACEIAHFPQRSVVLCGYSLLFLCCFGLCGNCLCLTVLINKYLGKTIFRVYLYALCIVDSLTLVGCLFMLVIPVLTDYSDCQPDVQSLVNYMILFFYPFGTFVENVSTLLTATISLVRLLSVKFPFQTRILNNKQTVTTVIALLFLFSGLFHIPRLFELHIQYCLASNNETIIATIAMTSLRDSHMYKSIYMTYSNTTLMFLLPFATILFCNTATVVLIVQNGPNRNNRSETRQRHRMTTKLLTVICLSFIVCHSLPFVLNTLEATETRLKANNYGWLVDISNFLVAVKASSNFLLYLMFNRKFRQSVAEPTAIQSWNFGQIRLVSRRKTDPYGNGLNTLQQIVE